MTETEKEKLEYTEICKQEYGDNNCCFSSGFVVGHKIDTMYLRMVKDGFPKEIILLRPDEMAAIAWVANGVLWSSLTEKLIDSSKGGKE